MDSQTNTPDKTAEPKATLKGLLLEVFKFGLISIFIVLPIRLYVAQPFIVKGQSMDPTFANGQYLIVDEVSYYVKPPERGEVIVFKYPKDPKTYFIKRIIGLPGETVVIKNGKVTIKTSGNPIGEELFEPYIGNPSYDDLTISLGDEEYFVMGDNRLNSLDSRTFGALPSEFIIGRTLARLYPVDDFALFPGKE